jgi:phytoene desaturase
MNSPLPELTPPIAAPDAPHALVIGSGFGGLAAAIRLGARGFRVTVLERLDAPGGRAYVHRQDGYTFDAGPTIVTAPFLLRELWNLCGKRFEDDVDLRLMSPFYRIRFDDGRVFDYHGDAEKTRAEIARFSPDDVAGYDRYMALSRRTYEVGFEKVGHLPFDSFADLLKLAPEFLALRAYRSVYNQVSHYVKDPCVRIVLSFHPLLVGGNPYAVPAVYTLISHLERHYGVYSAMGGTGSIVAGMVKLIRGQGNRLRYNSEVEEILVEEGRARGVRLKGGETIAADIVVSNADSAWTYRHLVPAASRRQWTDRRIARSRSSNGLFVWYFGTNRRYEDVPHHSIVLGPRYKGLLDDIFKHKKLSADFSLYLHRPTATDPSLAPPGCDAFYVLAPVPHLGGDTDWRTHAETFRRAVEKRLEESMLPGLGDAVVSSKVTTPLDFRDRLLSYRGAGFSFEPVLWQSASFRPHNRSEDVQGLYLVGAGTHPGAGMPGVLSSARVLDQVVPHANTFR